MLSLPLTGLGGDIAAAVSKQVFGWGYCLGNLCLAEGLPPSSEVLESLQEGRSRQLCHFLAALLQLGLFYLILVPPLSPAALKDVLVPKYFFLHSCSVSKAGGKGARRGDGKGWENSHTGLSLQGTAERVNLVSKEGCSSCSGSVSPPLPQPLAELLRRKAERKEAGSVPKISSPTLLIPPN